MNNTITPKERLMIAAQLLPMTASYDTSPYTPEERALQYTDELIKQSGCTVAVQDTEKTMD